MKNDCTKWKEQLLEAALTQEAAPALREHLLTCAMCAAELAALRTQRERLDALLPLVTREAEPSPDFRARVLAAAETAGSARREPRWRTWGLAGVAAMTVVAVVLALMLRSRIAPPAPEPDLAAAQKLAEWRAPSDVFLKTPGSEILRSTPKLGASFFSIPSQSQELRSLEPHKEK